MPPLIAKLILCDVLVINCDTVGDIIPVASPIRRAFVVNGEKCIKNAIFGAPERQALQEHFPAFLMKQFFCRP
jgi:hypothetical protein